MAPAAAVPATSRASVAPRVRADRRRALGPADAVRLAIDECEEMIMRYSLGCEGRRRPCRVARRLRRYRLVPTWLPITPPIAAPPTVPMALPPVRTAPPTAPMPAPTAVFWSRWDMPAQPLKPITAARVSAPATDAALT